MSGDNDELLHPEEIEALLNANRSDEPASDETASDETASEPAASVKPAAADDPPQDDTNDLLDPDAIEALLREASGGRSDDAPAQAPSPPVSQAPSPAPPTPLSASMQGTEQLLQQAEADLAAAIAPDLDAPREIPPDLANAKPFEFSDFSDDSAPAGSGGALHSLKDVELDLCIELGRTELLLEEVMKLKEGAVVPLNKLAGDPVDILVNDRLIARGEVLVLNDNFCVRVAEILAPED